MADLQQQVRGQSSITFVYTPGGGCVQSIELPLQIRQHLLIE